MEDCKVLIVEDEALVARDISTTLQQFGFSVVDMVDSAEASLAAVRAKKPDIVIMDIVLKDNQDGIVAAEIIKNEHDVPIIFLSTHTEDDIIKRATNSCSGKIVYLDFAHMCHQLLKYVFIFLLMNQIIDRCYGCF